MNFKSKTLMELNTEDLKDIGAGEKDMKGCGGGGTKPFTWPLVKDGIL